MEKTWKPMVAGILAIIAGVALVVIGPEILALPGRILAFPFIRSLASTAFAVGAVFVILGIIAIVGGIYALKRRSWGLALAGSICALPAGFLLGILAIIFVIMGRDEFDEFE
jgi:uncharacterized membrane protein HdeD (DUF308 family)